MQYFSSIHTIPSISWTHSIISMRPVARTTRLLLLRSTKIPRTRPPLPRLHPSSPAVAMSSTTTAASHPQAPNLDQETRRYPLRKPAGHKPPMPRWMLTFPSEITHLHTLYIGLQSHSSSSSSIPPSHPATRKIHAFLSSLDRTTTPYDTLRVTHGFDQPNTKVWIAYHASASPVPPGPFTSLDLPAIHRSLPEPLRSSTGLWLETFSTPTPRFEANYARLAHKPGAAQIPGISQPPHELTGYWGAARDRVPSSENDLFVPPPPASAAPTTHPSPSPSDPVTGPPAEEDIPRGIGQVVRSGAGTFYDNMAHIRSGQWWAECDAEERDAYEHGLRPTLMEGMAFLWGNAVSTGTLGLRVMENVTEKGDAEDDEAIRETCGAGFFRNWADQEIWSSTSPSHLAIFTGAIAHAKRFGDDRKFMTWHEVSILKRGELRVEYVNCVRETGVMRWVKGLEVEDLER